MTNFEFEEKKLLEYFIDTELIPTKKNITPNDIGTYAIAKNSLELTLNPRCDQHCSYCYLANYGDELYPNKCTKEEIIHNVDLFLDYVYHQRKCYFYTIELFGGEIVRNNIMFEVFELLKKYWNEIKDSEPALFKYRRTRIVIPSNLSFIPESKEIEDRIINYFNEFNDEFNARIMFSWSSDGPFGTETREKKNLNSEYFNKIWDFCHKVESGAHPMIAAVNVEHLKDNYDWWLEMYKNEPHWEFQFQPMMLEVRNDDWTDDAINKYMEFIDYALEKRLEMCGNDKHKLAYHLFVGDGKNGTLMNLQNYDFLYLRYKRPNSRYEKTSCSVQDCVFFNSTNMSLVLCHRTSHEHFTGAYFITDSDNSKIVDIKPGNLSFYLNMKLLKESLQPVCYNCEFTNLCLKGCFGAQYESNGDPLLPCASVCKMYRTKFDHIIKLYYEYGLIDIIQEDKLQVDKELYNFMIHRLKEMGYDIGV